MVQLEFSDGHLCRSEIYTQARHGASRRALIDELVAMERGISHGRDRDKKAKWVFTGGSVPRSACPDELKTPVRDGSVRIRFVFGHEIRQSSGQVYRLTTGFALTIRSAPVIKTNRELPGERADDHRTTKGQH